MFTEQKLEQHYSSIPSEALHIIRDEYKWALDECGVHNEEQIKYIEKTLSLRGESLSVRLNRKILFLCKCGQSRIVTTNVPDVHLRAVQDGLSKMQECKPVHLEIHGLILIEKCVRMCLLRVGKTAVETTRQAHFLFCCGHLFAAPQSRSPSSVSSPGPAPREPYPPPGPCGTR